MRFGHAATPDNLAALTAEQIDRLSRWLLIPLRDCQPLNKQLRQYRLVDTRGGLS